MAFLQDVFTGTKDVVLNVDVPQFTVPTQPELAVKLVFQALQHDTALMRYFDTDRVAKGKFPERAFFWGILFTTRKDLALELIKEVMDKRVRSMEVSEEAAQSFTIQPIWLEKLLEYQLLMLKVSASHTSHPPPSAKCQRQEDESTGSNGLRWARSSAQVHPSASDPGAVLVGSRAGRGG